MLTFVITNIFLLALGGMLFLMTRALPRVEEPDLAVRRGPLERWITSGAPERIDAAMKSFLSKFLRRSKILVLRVDNILTTKLQNMQKEEKVKPQFDQLISEREAETVEQ